MRIAPGRKRYNKSGFLREGFLSRGALTKAETLGIMLTLKSRPGVWCRITSASASMTPTRIAALRSHGALVTTEGRRPNGAVTTHWAMLPIGSQWEPAPGDPVLLDWEPDAWEAPAFHADDEHPGVDATRWGGLPSLSLDVFDDGEGWTKAELDDAVGIMRTLLFSESQEEYNMANSAIINNS